jgi:hypothetical protein
LRRLNPALAFILTSIVVATSVTFIGLALLVPSGLNTFEFNRDLSFVLFLFGFTWVITIGAGLAIGLPCLLALQALEVKLSLGVLASVGLFAGTIMVLFWD